MVIESGASQIFTNLKLVIYPARVKPQMAWPRTINLAELEPVKPGVSGMVCLRITSTIPAAWCEPVRRVLWEGGAIMATPYSNHVLLS